MANLRLLVSRRKAVRNIRKITRTMELIATARFKKAMDRAAMAEAYTRKIAEIAADLTSAGGEASHPLLAVRPDVRRVLLLVIGSNRGLAGGYNGSILREALGRVRQLQAAGTPFHIEVAGKKPVAALKYQQLARQAEYTQFEDKPAYEQVEPIADRYIQMFVTGQVDQVQVAYMKFLNAARQTPVDDGEVWRALAVRWEQFSGVLHHHHTTEDDVLWPQLLEIVDATGDNAGRETLEAMEAEHDLIDPLLAACAAGFGAMADAPDATERDQLVDSAEAARDTLSAHMGHEETAALPLVQALLSEEGWQRVEKAAGDGKSASDLIFLVPWVADGLSPAQLDAAFRSVGQAFRVLLILTRRRYARREAVAFRYA